MTYTQPRFTVSSYPPGGDWRTERIEQEYPYLNRAEHDEQRERALARYAQLVAAGTDRVIELSRLSIADLDAGDITPTLLRRSDDPEYQYEGFREVWDA